MRWKPYSTFVDSGIEWLGRIPQGWGIGRIRSVAAVRTGGTPDRNNPAYWEEGTIKWMSSGEVNRGQVFDTDSMITAQAAKETNAKPLPSDTVMVALNGQGKTKATAAILKVVAACNQSLAAIVPDPKRIHYSYLYWYLTSRYLDIRGLVGDDRDGLNLDHIRGIPLYLPSPEEQCAIAAFLSRETAKIDTLIAKQERLIELLQEKRQALISHAVTKGLDPTATMKQSSIEWLGSVPQSWTVNKLGRVVFMQEGPGLRTWQFTASGTRVICVTNITETGIDFSRLEKYISTEEYCSSYRHFTVRRGDVLLSSSGNSWGKVAIYDGEEEVILNTSTIRLNEIPGAPLCRDYITVLLQSDIVLEQLRLAMTGSCQPNFGPSHLNSVMVPIPVKAEQAAIVVYLRGETTRLETIIAEAQRAIGLLQERRAALISAAVTGKIDVREVQ